MAEIFSMPFMQRALIAGVLVGFLCGYYGVFLVQRKMSFLGSGLGHSAFGGVALGLLLGVNPLAAAIPFTLAVAILIILIREKTRLESDTAIGILFAVSVALGIVFINLKQNYSVDAFSYLFGSIIAVDTADVWAAAGLSLITLGTLPRMWGRWAFATFDSELARADGINTKTDDYALSLLIAITVVVSIKIVGIILIAAFLVIPAAAARMLANRFSLMALWSVIIGIFGSAIGLWMSYVVDIPAGATIILVMTIVFIISIFIKKAR
jgi:zinc transport system permease protein